MDKLEGYIERIKYRNEDNGYTVFVVSSGRDEITCVGNFLVINEGEYYEMTGAYVNHAMYGKQFQVSVAKAGTPKTVSAMEKYLGSGAIKGIGAPMAKRIVDHFGEATFDIIDNNPERLVEIRGISEKKASDIYKQFEEKREVRDTMIFLQNYGISTTFAVKIYNQYGARTKEVVSENPYRLAEDINGISFEYADNLARQCGFNIDSEYRIKAGLIYYIKQYVAGGHAYFPEKELINFVKRALINDEAVISGLINSLIDEKSIIAKKYGDERRLYLPVYYYTELAIARMLHDLDVTDRITGSEIERRVSSVERRLSIELDELQKDALRCALRHALMIITGGPGTGKTTTINALIEMFSSEGAEILLAAPTGRAAKRMSEATGREARTIHRLLEFLPGGTDDDESKASFNRNAEYPLEADLIIIDEASMIDMFLMKSLLSAILVGTRVIFVGDVRQLPSVGPGNVLKDMIESECIEVVRLNKIFRQDEESDIVVYAHMIDEGEYPLMDNKSKDFFLMSRDTPESMLETVTSLVKDKLPKYVKVDSFDIQVLAPQRRGTAGIINLNKVLQEKLNPPSKDKKETEVGENLFREGDKVMQIKNDYQLEWKTTNAYGITVDGGLGVFNGDIGIIKEINQFAEYVTVIFDGDREVEYPFQQLDELMLAYAVTVHKSQGNEYPAVVLPLIHIPGNLAYRNLLYTAITRASRCVVIVGNRNTVYNMIDNDKESRRLTGLREAIQECYK